MYQEVSWGKGGGQKLIKGDQNTGRGAPWIDTARHKLTVRSHECETFILYVEVITYYLPTPFSRRTQSCVHKVNHTHIDIGIYVDSNTY